MALAAASFNTVKVSISLGLRSSRYPVTPSMMTKGLLVLPKPEYPRMLNDAFLPGPPSPFDIFKFAIFP